MEGEATLQVGGETIAPVGAEKLVPGHKLSYFVLAFAFTFCFAYWRNVYPLLLDVQQSTATEAHFSSISASIKQSVDHVHHQSLSTALSTKSTASLAASQQDVFADGRRDRLPSCTAVCEAKIRLCNKLHTQLVEELSSIPPTRLKLGIITTTAANTKMVVREVMSDRFCSTASSHVV